MDLNQRINYDVGQTPDIETNASLQSNVLYASKHKGRQAQSWKRVKCKFKRNNGVVVLSALDSNGIYDFDPNSKYLRPISDKALLTYPPSKLDTQTKLSNLMYAR